MILMIEAGIISLSIFYLFYTNKKNYKKSWICPLCAIENFWDDCSSCKKEIKTLAAGLGDCGCEQYTESDCKNCEFNPCHFLDKQMYRISKKSVFILSTITILIIALCVFLPKVWQIGVLSLVTAILLIEVLALKNLLKKHGLTAFLFSLQNFKISDNIWYDHPYLSYALKPNRNIGRFHINSLGGRGPDPIDDSRGRILCMGGSTTFDAAHDFKDTWPGLLQDKAGTAYQVINGGNMGATTADTLAHFASNYQDLKADYLVIYHGTNDLEASYANNFRSDYSHRRKTIGDMPYPFFKRLPNFLNYCASFVLWRYKLVGSQGNLYSGYSRPATWNFKDGPFGFETFERNIRSLHALARINSTKVILSSFLYHKDWAVIKYGQDFADAWEYGINEHNKILKKLASEFDDIIFSDLSSYQTGVKTHIDFCHLTKFGNDIIAEEISQKIQNEEKANAILSAS